MNISAKVSNMNGAHAVTLITNGRETTLAIAPRRLRSPRSVAALCGARSQSCRSATSGSVCIARRAGK